MIYLAMVEAVVIIAAAIYLYKYKQQLNFEHARIDWYKNKIRSAPYWIERDIFNGKLP